MERNGQQKRKRNRKTWCVLIMIYLCCFKVGSMDLGLQLGVTIFVNTVNSVHPFSIVIVNDYTRRGGSCSDHGKRDMLKRIMFQLFPQ